MNSFIYCCIYSVHIIIHLFTAVSFTFHVRDSVNSHYDCRCQYCFFPYFDNGRKSLARSPAPAVSKDSIHDIWETSFHRQMYGRPNILGGISGRSRLKCSGLRNVTTNQSCSSISSSNSTSSAVYACDVTT